MFVTSLCGFIGEIPDGIEPELPEDAPKVLSSSAYIKALTESGDCAVCHVDMNPYGVALSAFSEVGKYREIEQVPHIETGELEETAAETIATATIDNQEVTFNGATEMSEAIGNSRQAHACFVQRFTQFAVGEYYQSSCGITDADFKDTPLRDTILGHRDERNLRRPTIT